MFKKQKQNFASWRLGRAIKSGKVARGRTVMDNVPVTPEKRNAFRAFWLEMCLRFRTLRASLKFLFSLPDVGGGFGGEVFPTGRLFATVIRADGGVNDIGLISTKVVTDDGVAFIVDAFQNTVELENMKYHGSGTGSVAEAAGDSALGTEVATRSTGTTTEGASANIYRTVATISYSGSFAITEHGIFSASSAGVLLDRSVFSAINVTSGDAIQFTYDLTFPSGS